MQPRLSEGYQTSRSTRYCSVCERLVPTLMGWVDIPLDAFTLLVGRATGVNRILSGRRNEDQN